MDIDFPIDADWVEAIQNAIRIAHEIKNESDRGVVLVTAAFLDEQLEMLLDRHFIDVSNVKKDLLKQSGPLGTFSSRIKLAYCLDLIHPEQYSDLQTIRKLRNEFAHTHHFADFDSEKVRDLCNNLKSYHSFPELQQQVDVSSALGDMALVRNQFLANAFCLFVWLPHRVSLSVRGIIDATRFIERDMKETGGEHLQRIIEEMDS